MAVKFFNTLTRSLEEFTPRQPGKVSLYTCGPTVHDYAHIGNFRTYVFEDLLRRYLKYRGFQVTQVMNLTDVEDKIIKKAEAAGVHFKEYTAPYCQAFFEDLKTLNIEAAEHYPRATDFVDGMVEMIRDLLSKGIAYRSEDGSIYFNIAKFPGYGKLANIQVDELVCGARVAQDEYEKDRACDFALWKAWDEGDGHVFWDQYPDLGKGRPGWHIECSAMSRAYLGDSFDIHCGGVDNIFPHHQNEIAQSEAFSGTKFVTYWLHSEHLQVESAKMSKSKGNFITLRDLLRADQNPSGRAYEPSVVRYALLSVHYRSRLNFKYDGLHQDEKALERISDFLRRCGECQGGAGAHDDRVGELVNQARSGFVEAMDNDLHIAEGLARLFEFITGVNKLMDEGPVSGQAGQACVDLWLELDQVLGLDLAKRIQTGPLDSEIELLIEERQQARKTKNFARSDEIRKLLADQGIVLEDTPQGVRWKRSSP
ncbi:cysteine--tRNA ligase [bacterium]|nr:cysteine--tRNA ligase [bacterium]